MFEHVQTTGSPKVKLLKTAVIDLGASTGYAFTGVGQEFSGKKITVNYSFEQSPPSETAPLPTISAIAGILHTSKPEQTVGFGYQSTGDLEKSLEEILDNYAHYKKTALNFSYQWNKENNASQIFEKLR